MMQFKGIRTDFLSVFFLFVCSFEANTIRISAESNSTLRDIKADIERCLLCRHHYVRVVDSEAVSAGQSISKLLLSLSFYFFFLSVHKTVQMIKMNNRQV